MATRMPVYTAIGCDGRVQRAAEALGASPGVAVPPVGSGKGCRNARFRPETVRVPETARLRGFLHLIFLQRLSGVVHAHDVHSAVGGTAANPPRAAAGCDALATGGGLVVRAAGPAGAR